MSVDDKSAGLPSVLPSYGVYDSLFSGLPFGGFIGRYWWILLLIFYLFVKPRSNQNAYRT